MEILDWRSGGERFLTSWWGGLGMESTRSVGVWGQRWAVCHQWLMRRRLANRARLPGGAGLVPVVSVGNLALGGTGKTPVVIALAHALAADGVAGVVLTRGFRSPLAGPLAVDPANERAGDEARLLAEALSPSGWSVVQARDRMAGLRHVHTTGSAPAMVLLEDGYQTAGVGRDLDVLILDQWHIRETEAGPCVVPQTGAVFPFGPWREGAAGARRASIWLLETAGEAPTIGLWGNTVVTFQREMSCRCVKAPVAEACAAARPALVSGIARPQQFEDGCQRVLGWPTGAVAVRLADHQPYDRALAVRLTQMMAARHCESLVTTAKDWVKLAQYWPDGFPVYVMDLRVRWGGEKTLPELVSERLNSLPGGCSR